MEGVAKALRKAKDMGLDRQREVIVIEPDHLGAPEASLGRKVTGLSSFIPLYRSTYGQQYPRKT